MAKYGPSDAYLIVGGKDLTGDHYVLEEMAESVIEKTNALGDSWEEHTPVGLGRIVLEANGGLYDDRTFAMIAAFQNQPLTPASAAQLVAFGFTGHTPGDNAVILNGTYVGTWKRMAQRDGLTKAHALHMITGDRKEAKVLHGISAETAASGNTEGASSVDNGASSANGATADLHVPALTLGGYTDVTIKVRHSADDITYADLITFTNVTAAGTAQRGTAAGTVDRHLACSWLFNGAGAGQSISFYVATNRG